MKHAAVLACLLLTFCATGGGPRSTSTAASSGPGAITIEIVPNPIVATRVSGNTYDFAFEVVLRETGGRPIDIERVSADVLALGTIRVAQESYDAARIRQLGFETRVPANGSLRYRFTQRREVPDDRLFGGVSAEVRVDGRDDAGNRVEARTSVTVTR